MLVLSPSSETAILDPLRREGRSNMRGSAVIPFSPDEDKALSLHRSSVMTSDLIEKSINDADFLLTEKLSSVLTTDNFSEEELRVIHRHLTDLEIGPKIKALTSMLHGEIKPMMLELTASLEDHLPQESRHLAGIFDPNTSEVDDTKSSTTSSSGGTENPHPFSKDDYESFAEGRERIGNFFKGKAFSNSDILRFMGQGGLYSGLFGKHHRRRSHVGRSPNVRRPSERRRLQDVAAYTCDAGCTEEDDPKRRKKCNCEDLFFCVRQLKITDFAVMLSRGLVDKDTGTIEVEKVNVDNSKLWTADASDLLDQDGNLRKENNAAANDMFDAQSLLEKINRIRGLTMPVASEYSMLQNCGDLLSEFHVPCKDWQNGCAGSDGRSYQMVRESANAGRLILAL